MPFYPTQLEAYAYFVGATGAPITTRGCTVTRLGVGNYNIILDTELDNSVMISDFTFISAGGGINFTANIDLAASSDGTKNIRTTDSELGIADDPFQLQVKIKRVEPPS